MRQFLFFIIIIFTFLIDFCWGSSSSLRIQKLCLYLKAIKRSSDSCEKFQDKQKLEVSSTISPLAQIIANIEKRAEKQSFRKKKLPMCSTNVAGYQQCRREDQCSSGFSCESFDKLRCCLKSSHAEVMKQPAEKLPNLSNLCAFLMNFEIFSLKTCPPTMKMPFSCQKSSINRIIGKKCRVDNDCLFRNLQKCCSTGCGFNVCINTNENNPENALIFLQNN